MNKAEIRKSALVTRKNLSDHDFRTRNDSIVSKAIDLVGSSSVSWVHLFLPIARKREVDTWPLYHFLLNSEDHTPALSRTNFNQNTLSHHPMEIGDGISESDYGIPEPTHQRIIEPQVLDLVFVPLLAFDHNGHRVGYGAGFYDRFLAQCRTDCVKVGLSLLPALATLIDKDPLDIPLDYCIGPSGIHEFQSK